MSRPSYQLPPLQRRSVVLGLTTAPAAALGAGAVAALAALTALPGPVGVLAAAVAVAGGAVAGFWPLAGDPPARWLPVALGWLGRRPSTLIDPAPELGSGAGAATAGDRPLPPGRRRTAPAGVSLTALPPVPGEPEVAAVLDRRSRRIVAALPVGGPALGLLDPLERDAMVAGWGSLLATVSRSGSAVRRLQWVVQRGPADLGELREEAAAVAGDDRAVAAYRDLVAGAPAWAVGLRTHLVVAVDGRGRRDRQAADDLRRELRLLRSQLGGTGLRAGPPLSPAGLAGLIAATSGPDHHAGAAGPWPTARREHWSSLQVDGGCTATYWVAEWPQVPVGPEALGVLVGGRSPAWRSVAVVMAPVPPERAVRQAQSARTAGVADDALRARAGFLATARRAAEAEAVERREAELAAGHGELRFAGYVTVGGADPAALAAAGAEVVQQAASAGIVLRLLHGRQGDAWSYTMPLARGVA